jgi:gliding motility-associated-like protein
MKWWVLILLPFHLLAQETYDNCIDIPVQTYQVDYDADKEYYWHILGPGTNGFSAPVSTNGNTLSIYWPDSIGTYTIAIYTTRFGCEGDTSYHEVLIEECDYAQLFFPNSFTPNGDNHNEVYQVEGRAADEIEYFAVYNRWGQIVFEVDGNMPWDGANCQIGLYTINVFVRNNRYVRTIALVR